MLAVDFDVLGCAVGRLIAVPWRKINAEFQSLASRSLGQLLDDVALAVAVGTEADAMIGCLRGPQAKAVVMFAGQDDTAASSGLQNLANSIGIEGARIENRRVFVAVTPFAIRERIDREVEKIVKLEFAPSDLRIRRKRAVGGWRWRLARGKARSLE